MKYCFIGGDSFEEDNLNWSPTTGQLIAEHHDLAWRTHAKGGQGNMYILNTIIQNIHSRDYSMALVNWSSIDRKDYITAFSNWQVEPYHKALRISDTHFSLGDQVLFENLNYIANAQMILEGAGIPYCMWWGINSMEQTKNKKCLELIEIIKSKHTFYNFDNCLYEKAKKDGHLCEYDGKHPSREAHRRWSLDVIRFMESRNIKARV